MGVSVMGVFDDLPNHPVRRRIALAERADYRRARLAVVKEPSDWQEDHSPTDNYEVRLTGQKKTTIARRRKSDARLWESMSGHQQDAAIRIARAFELITSGTAARAQTYERSGIVGIRPPSRAQIEVVEEYFQWAEAVLRAHLSHAAVVDVLVVGESCHSVDSARSKRNGWTKQNLLDCLNIYCQQQGWPQNVVARG